MRIVRIKAFRQNRRAGHEEPVHRPRYQRRIVTFRIVEGKIVAGRGGLNILGQVRTAGRDRDCAAPNVIQDEAESRLLARHRRAVDLELGQRQGQLHRAVGVGHISGLARHQKFKTLVAVIQHHHDRLFALGGGVDRNRHGGRKGHRDSAIAVFDQINGLDADFDGRIVFRRIEAHHDIRHIQPVARRRFRGRDRIAKPLQGGFETVPHLWCSDFGKAGPAGNGKGQH